MSANELLGDDVLDAAPAIDERQVSMMNLRTHLQELYDLREAEGLSQDEVKAIDGQIRVLVEANLRKVDNVRAYWRFLEDQLAARKQDREDAAREAAGWEQRLECLKSLCGEVMEQFKEKRLVGEHGFIRLQANGGDVALDVYNPALVPEEMVDYSGTITSSAWNQIVELCSALGEDIRQYEGVRLERVLRVGMIRNIMKAPCAKCDGAGTVLESDGELATVECPECKGAKLQTVPGARLGARGQHVRIR